jgi:hypothetical protein
MPDRSRGINVPPTVSEFPVKNRKGMSGIREKVSRG